ncbi:toll/interleukin-1 receptor domain-containing protein [Pseudomonas sp. B21-053]|nr:toll/interleukin-1 receptor domain-containing protein [Pseudomonas sp. B21-053]UZE14740.1 toll/interleukin-1 receptor domain-containing protein [Pseudomonas sp. B21-053]
MPHWAYGGLADYYHRRRHHGLGRPADKFFSQEANCSSGDSRKQLTPLPHVRRTTHKLFCTDGIKARQARAFLCLRKNGVPLFLTKHCDLLQLWILFTSRATGELVLVWNCALFSDVPMTNPMPALSGFLTEVFDMAYVGLPFTHDLFVSYSHGRDDGKGKGLLQPWSAVFVEALERELLLENQLCEDLRIFIDKDARPGHGVDPMSPLTDQLREHINGSALLVILMSDPYLASAWCTDERNWWCQHQEKIGFGINERIAVVKIWPTTGVWPPPLSDSRGEHLVGFDFHSLISGKHRPLGWADEPISSNPDFRKATIGIVAQLLPKLNKLKARLEEHARAEAEIKHLHKPGGQTIYLHGRADQAQTWEKAGLALADKGFFVLPGSPDAVNDNPQKIQEAREQRVEILSDCDALLLVGTANERALDADLVVIGKHDRQSARSRSNRLLPCGLLNTVGTAIVTPMRQASARHVQADWIDGTKDDWTSQIQQWLQDKSSLSGGGL